MEDTLEVYHRQQDPKRPVVCLDEASKQLTKETRLPLPPRPGAVAKYDYEYERNGTSNLFPPVRTTASLAYCQGDSAPHHG